MKNLKDKSCVVCEDKNIKPLPKEKVDRMLAELKGWAVAKNNKSISKELVFKNFDKAMDFVNLVADIAELEGHHPDIHICYNKVEFVLYTHSVRGLTENDFILASKIDGIHI